MLVLWVTDNPVHKNVERLRAAGYDVLLTQVPVAAVALLLCSTSRAAVGRLVRVLCPQTFAEGMKVLRRNTNVTHVVNNIHRCGARGRAATLPRRR